MLSGLTPWRLVLLTLAVTCAGIAPTFYMLWPKWSDSFTYSHGLLILPLSAWLLWQLRDRINAEPVKTNWWGSTILVGLLLAWTLAFASNIEVGTSATWPLIMLAAVLLVAGSRIAMLVAFPILLLYSAIPLWDFLNGTLQSLTTTAVAAILALIQVPAFIQGNVVQIPSGVFAIAGGCSGLHFFIVGLTLAVVYAHLYLKTVKSRAILIVVAAFMSICMNWIRVATIITSGHLTDMQSYLVQVDHYYFGWVLFAVMLVPFFLLARKLEDSGTDAEEDTAVAVSLAPGTASITAVAVVFAIAFLPALVWGRLVQNEPAPVDVELPNLQDWEGPSQTTSGWQPIFPEADGEAIGTYERGGRVLEVYVNWFQSQSQGRELIGYGNSVAGHTTRTEYDRKYVDTTGRNDAKLLEFREILISSREGERRLIWYHFLVGDRPETDALTAKLRQGLRSLVGRDGTGLFAVSTVCELSDTDCATARQLLRAQFAELEMTRNHHE